MGDVNKDHINMIYHRQGISDSFLYIKISISTAPLRERILFVMNVQGAKMVHISKHRRHTVNENHIVTSIFLGI